MKYLITTPRLRLREMEMTDAPAMFELNSDPEVMRYTGDTAFENIAGAERITEYVRAQYVQTGMGRLLVELTETGEPLGWCGLKYHPDSEEIDLGYRFYRRYWGKGYATECAGACLQYGFEVLRLNRIMARAEPENIGSVRVLEKTGFKYIGEEIEDDAPLSIFEQYAPRIKAKITLVQGDITQVPFDAIVNAANSSLLGGGGVDGAIHRAGGPAILEQCREIGGCKTGQAVITTGGNLPARFVIHTVGPIWHGKTAAVEDKLADCYRNSLALALKTGLKTVAFPNISTGVYRFPKEDACRIAVQTVQAFLAKNEGLDEVRFVCFDAENHALYAQALL